MNIYREAAREAGIKAGPERDAAIAAVKASSHEHLVAQLASEIHEALMDARTASDLELVVRA